MKLDSLRQQMAPLGERTQPPLDQWHPDLSGDIDIEIRRDGSWWHEGERIARSELVQVFASILRREADGDYYLVTPVEKWRLRVEALPLVVTDVALRGDELVLTLNIGREVTVDSSHPLRTEPAFDQVASVQLEHGLAALFNRPAWYRLVELAEEREGVTGVSSRGHFYPLQ